MRERFACLCAALTLTSCGPMLDSNAWYVSRYKDSYGSLFEPESKPRQADPRPDVKKLIGGNLPAVFGRTTVKDVNVGPPRPNGYGWTACVRAEVTGIVNRSIGVQYIMVEIDGGQIGLRRPAEPRDRCESETFAPTG